MEPDRNTVLEAIKLAFPYDWENVFQSMRWSSIDECWYYNLHGITVGIETDGFVHS